MEDFDNCFSPKGAINIGRAGKIREELINCLQNEGVLNVDLSHVTRLDFSFIQIMYALKKEADMLQKKLSFSGLDNQTVHEAFYLSGCDLKIFSK